MQSPHSRLICRAHNRFTPAFALWAHFIDPNRPFLPHCRLSSTATKASQDAGTILDTDSASAGASTPQDSNAEVSIERKPTIKIKRPTTTKGEWYPSKKAASIAKNRAARYAFLVSARTEHDRHREEALTTALRAFDTGEDYKGVVIQTKVDPPENLPWALPAEERSMKAMDRLNIEIDRFYHYTRPNRSESLVRKHVIDQVKSHVRQFLPDFDLEVFGSEKTGLAFATADIDLRLLKKKSLGKPIATEGPPPEKEKLNIEAERKEMTIALRSLYWKFLRRHKAYHQAHLRHARYPLISMQDEQSGIDIQIVDGKDTSVSQEFMSEYMEQYPYLRPLHFVVRAIFDTRGLSDVFRGGFGSYTLFMMLVASIKLDPHARNDAAGALLNFLDFYTHFDTTKKCISIDPLWIFGKEEQAVMTNKTKSKIKKNKTKPLPPFMLCLRDPADPTNDLGRRAVAIKHVQKTFSNLIHPLLRDLKLNTRHSLLGSLVGASYVLQKNSRDKLNRYADRVAQELDQSLARKAKQIREEETADEEMAAMKAEEERLQEQQKRRAAKVARDKLRESLMEKRNELLRAKAEANDVSQNGELTSSDLDKLAINYGGTHNSKLTELPLEDSSEPVSDTEKVFENLPIKEANAVEEKRSIDVTSIQKEHESSTRPDLL